ncbi:DISARM system phospholipase D-like protein DrmC [Actinacidiphila oryziradicis]|uniref:DISARM system phospholipase D-like protein DrmC n=1 Tax=Actinacidiphila oryziradicis TaxID=2571141 RepID=UPI00145C88EE|nr:DISARM system phospholipase D-like protein DrmC [Actinacidiphila oryziradicis]
MLSGLVASLPGTHLTAWIRVLRTTDAPDELTESRLIAAHPGADLGPRAALLLSSWTATDPQLPGTALALALEAVSNRYEQDLASHHVDIAVSGPISDTVPVRLTASVAIEVIRSATSTLLVTSYAAFGIQEIVNEIRAAADRGVSVDLVLETARCAGGKLYGEIDGRNAFHELRFHADVHLWQWANDERRGPGGQRGSMHAKVIAADRGTVLLGSANLTDNAYNDNLEIGAVIRDPTAVANLVDHFKALMHSDDSPLVRLPWARKP